MPLSSQSTYYEPGSTHTVVLLGDVVGKLESVEISWEYRVSVFNPLTWRLLHTPRVYIDSLSVESLEAAHRYVSCYNDIPSTFVSIFINDIRSLPRISAYERYATRATLISKIFLLSNLALPCALTNRKLCWPSNRRS